MVIAFVALVLSRSGGHMAPLRLLNPGRRCLKMKMKVSMIIANNVGVGAPLWVIAWGSLSRPSSNSACAFLVWPGGAAVAKVMLFYEVV